MRIMVLHFGSEDNPRIQKVVRSLRSAGDEVYFVGWDRDPDIPKRGKNSATQIFMFKKKEIGKKAGILPLFYFFGFVFSILRSIKPDVVHCINEEMVLLALPFKRTLFRRIVLDSFDMLADRVVTNAFGLPVVLRVLVNIAYIFSDFIIVCDKRRFKRMGKYNCKTIIVENTPVDPGDSLSKLLLSGHVTIALIGNITERRGAGIAISALEKTPSIRMITAGKLDKFSEELFLNKPQITQLGIITPEQCLCVIAKCDAVLALYEPTTQNHIFASPSKLFDCMSVGRPVIINSETAVSSWVNENKLGYSVEYSDVDGLVKIFESLVGARIALPEFARNSRSLYESDYSWNVMEKRILGIYDKIKERDLR